MMKKLTVDIVAMEDVRFVLNIQKDMIHLEKYEKRI